MTGIYTTSRYLLLIVILGFAGGSCTKKDTSLIPTYVHIDSFAFNPVASLPADVANTHQINSVWAFYNNSPIGVFDLPANIPVITNGNGKLTLRPGISVSGLNNFLATYPFYTSDTSTLIPQPGKTITYLPTTSYYTSTKFSFISKFEPSTGTRFKLVSGSVPMTINGDKNGVITLTAPNDTLSEDSSYAQFAIPLNKDAYIEFDYKCTVPFAVGLRANLASIYTIYYLAGIYPSDHWQKFYLSVKDFEAQYQATNYSFYIKTALPAGETTGTVMIDNIQLVYFD